MASWLWNVEVHYQCSSKRNKHEGEKQEPGGPIFPRGTDSFPFPTLDAEE